jgi:hypothetical protein
MISEIIKIDKYKLNQERAKYNSYYLNIIRDYIESKLGKLDTAHTFMYLYMAYGVPYNTVNDDSEIMYDYIFQFKDIVFCIHSSYKRFVFFNFLLPVDIVPTKAPEWDDTIEQYPDLKKQIDGIIENLRIGFYVRDVKFNFIGYENKNNLINKYFNYEEEEEDL